MHLVQSGEGALRLDRAIGMCDSDPLSHTPISSFRFEPHDAFPLLGFYPVCDIRGKKGLATQSEHQRQNLSGTTRLAKRSHLITIA